MRRLLAHALLVLAGAAIATIAGWLLSAGTASADVLPAVPIPAGASLETAAPLGGTAPSALSKPGLVDQPAQLLSSTPGAVPPSVLTSPGRPNATLVGSVLPGRLAGPAVSALADPPSAPVPRRALGQVADGVRLLPVSGLGWNVLPSGTPQLTSALVPAATQQTTEGPRRPVLAAGHPRVNTPLTACVRSLAPQPNGAPVGESAARSAVGSSDPAGVNWRGPMLPPMQPAGPTDASVHAPSLAGGPGGAGLPVATVLGTGLSAAGPSDPPRPAVTPGHQPGTSPD